jgi:two-component sensor histidine kinase
VPVASEVGQPIEKAGAEAREAVVSSVGRSLIRLVGGIPPYSFRAVVVAALCFLGALVSHIVFRQLGGSLSFVTYYPAVLAAALLAGFPAATFVIVSSVVTVWWAFMPPAYDFFPLSRAQQVDLLGYLIASAAIVAAAELYRSALWRLHENEQQRELVMKELEHRGRNTYAVIDVIVQKTLEDEPERASVISGRIRAVKYANDLLNQTSAHTVLLKTLLLHEFVPYGEMRFHTEGPEVELAPDAARHLALVFHELVTNAAKHGALSKPGGRVVISWKKADAAVRLEWREEGGPVVSPPTKHGFGSKIVTQSVKSVSGSIAPTFAPEGLRCSITFRV